MTNPGHELIVRFAARVSEAEARSVVEAAGGTIKRRMRWDPQDEVLLLVRAAATTERALRTDARVEHVEINADDYTPMS